MRKQTKIAAVVAAAALVAIGGSMTAMAASGWQQENGQWIYLDANGDYVTGEWKRSGDNYFYLDWDGYMATNSLIQDGDNYYWVDANGAMVKNQWIAVPTDDADDPSIEHRWYYFGSTGRAYRDASGFAKKTILGKKYAFDDQGRMLYGWVDGDGMEVNDYDNPCLEATYFFRPNDTTTVNGITYTGGEMWTGWYLYEDGIDEYEYEGLDYIYQYFNPTTGVKVEGTTKRIEGYTYVFDEDGIMLSGWQPATGSVAAGSQSQYYNADNQGWRQKNSWVWAVPSEDMTTAGTDHEDETYRWFYVGADGKVTADKARRINSKWYIFNEDGIMKTGLISVVNNDGSEVKGISAKAQIDEVLKLDEMNGDEVKAYPSTDLFYFSQDEAGDGSMKTGSNVQIELADGEYTFGFERNGLAFHGEENKKIYNHGILLTGGDMRYDVAQNPVSKKYYVVGPTGTFASNNSTVRDADDNYYAVVGGYIFFVPASDDAAKVAKAIVTIGKGDNSGLYVEDGKTNEDGELVYRDGMRRATDAEVADGTKTLYVKSSSDYVEVAYETYWESSYTPNFKGNWFKPVTE